MLDDKDVLESIKTSLGCGRFSYERDTIVFTISQLRSNCEYINSNIWTISTKYKKNI